MNELKIMPYKTRLYKLHPHYKKFSCDGDLYSWIINDWIPAQPDFEDLMRLFIKCAFNLNDFLMLVVDRGPKGGKRKSA